MPKKASTIAERVKSEMTFSTPYTTADVQRVLAYVGKPGKWQNLKREVVRLVFPVQNRQGHQLADAIANYEEF